MDGNGHDISDLRRELFATVGGRAHRPCNLLVRERYETLQQVADAADAELLSLRGFGEVGLRMVRKGLAAMGYTSVDVGGIDGNGLSLAERRVIALESIAKSLEIMASTKAPLMSTGDA